MTIFRMNIGNFSIAFFFRHQLSAFKVLIFSLYSAMFNALERRARRVGSSEYVGTIAFYPVVSE